MQPEQKSTTGPGWQKLKLNVGVAKEKQIVREKATKRIIKLKEQSPAVSKDRDTENALKWLNKSGGEALDNESDFRKLNAMLPVTAGQSNEHRALELAKALKFLRKKGIENRTKEASVYGQSMSTATGELSNDAPKSEPTHEQQLASALTFLNANQQGSDTSQLEDAKYFSKLNSMLPKRMNQTMEARAEEMVKMLGWLKKKGKMNIVDK